MGDDLTSLQAGLFSMLMSHVWYGLIFAVLIALTLFDQRRQYEQGLPFVKNAS